MTTALRASLRPSTVLTVTLAAVAMLLVTEAPASAAVPRSVTTTSPGWSVTLEVEETTVQVGRSIASTLIVTDETGHPATVYSCAANGVYGINLESSRIPNGPVTGAVACTSTLRPGHHVFRKRISTDYETCGGATDRACPAPLPVGVYHTVMNWPRFSAPVPTPGDLTIRLTQAPARTIPTSSPGRPGEPCPGRGSSHSRRAGAAPCP